MDNSRLLNEGFKTALFEINCQQQQARFLALDQKVQFIGPRATQKNIP
jgi:hypothetical protein